MTVASIKKLNTEVSHFLLNKKYSKQKPNENIINLEKKSIKQTDLITA